LGLSQTLIQTIQILKEAKTGPKPWKNKKKSPPRHLSSFSSDPLVSWVDFFFLFSRGFCHLGPKMPQNPWKNKKKVSPHVTCPASPQTFSWVETFVFLFFLCSRGFCHIGPKMPQNPWKKQKKQNKLRRYPQQPQRFIFTNLFESCCEAKRWKNLSWVSVS